MKKILLAGTALVGFAALATPAHAELKTELGGFFRGYGVYSDDSPPAGTSLHTFELRRDSEVHFNGEATLDNGLTVGAHTEIKLGTGAAPTGPNAALVHGDAVTTDEAYAYFSGGWGRVNFGSEDGAAYLLQVAAPSADSNVDGLRTYISDNTSTSAASAAVIASIPASLLGLTTLDYDDVSDPTGAPNTNRITYLTPKFSGFQAGVSYAPLSAQQDPQGLGIAGPAPDNVGGDFDNIWEGSARWDGEFQGFGIGVGGGYSRASLEANGAAAPNAGVGGVSDNYGTWNAGTTLSWSGFSLGGDYLRGTTKQLADGTAGGGVSQAQVDLTQNTWVVGGAWDNGPYHVGASYLNQKVNRDGTAAVARVDFDTDRWTVGGGYTYGPGMTFRGAAAFGSFDPHAGAGTSNDFTQVTLGTDIQF